MGRVNGIDVAAQRRYKRRNAAQALLLLGGMVGMAALCAWVLAGLPGVWWVAVLGLVALALRPSLPSAWVLRMYGARALPPGAAPELHQVVRALSARAELPAVPQLHYVASSMLNAFAVGRRHDAAIGVTDGLLRCLTGRELAGVLAHEISHVRADDLWIMTLADTVSRVSHALSYAGLILVVLGLPVLTATGAGDLLIVALALTVTPTVVTLLQLALSRSREYDADLEAARLTGDPEGLARALRKLERVEGGIWERILVPHRRPPDPLLLRTHPPTDRRVERLLALSAARRPDVALPDVLHAPGGYPRVGAAPRLRPPGVWR